MLGKNLSPAKYQTNQPRESLTPQHQKRIVKKYKKCVEHFKDFAAKCLAPGQEQKLKRMVEGFSSNFSGK